MINYRKSVAFKEPHEIRNEEKNTHKNKKKTNKLLKSEKSLMIEG